MGAWEEVKGERIGGREGGKRRRGPVSAILFLGGSFKALSMN